MGLEHKRFTLASCNVEGNKHTPNVVAFLREFSPDIVCLQEALETGVYTLAETFGYDFAFRAGAVLQANHIPNLPHDEHIGLAILSRSPILFQNTLTYAGDGEIVPTYIHSTPDSRRREILYVDLKDKLRIATTHFTWSQNGEVNAMQTEDLRSMLTHTPQLAECILTGDFNIPRPNVLYYALIQQYIDCMPSYFASSIDPHLHRRGQELRLLVDYVFRTQNYQVDNVELVPGVSDHKAVVATIHRLETAP